MAATSYDEAYKLRLEKAIEDLEILQLKFHQFHEDQLATILKDWSPFVNDEHAEPPMNQQQQQQDLQNIEERISMCISNLKKCLTTTLQQQQLKQEQSE